MHYADVSLSVLKLMGPGEYVLMRPGDDAQGHFGLAAHDYTHSTAPNRRFADLVTQRLVKSLGTGAAPYADERAGRHRAQLHAERGCRAQSGARHDQAHGGGGAAQPRGPDFLRRW